MKQLLTTTLAAMLLAGCANAPQSSSPAASAEATAPRLAPINEMFAEYWEANLEHNPVTATYIGDPRYNDRLPDTGTAAWRAKDTAFNQYWLGRAQAYDADALPVQDRISLEVFLRERRESLEGDRFPGHLIPINQFYNIAGLLAQLGSGTSAQPFASVKDYEDWLSRAGKIPGLFDTAILNMREGIRLGVVQPRVLIEKVLPQFDALISNDPEQTLFWRPVSNFPEAFSEADKTRLAAAYRALISDELMPTYRRMRAFIADLYLPQARETVGLNGLPDGEAWYAFLAKVRTTTDRSPAEIHQIGLDEVARIHAEMRRVIKDLEFDGDLQDFFKFLANDPQFEFESEEALLKAYNGLREQVEQGAEKLFDVKPKAGFEIRPVEAFRAKSAAGGSYQRPSQDGSRPGVFYVNTYDLPSRKIWDMEDLFLHEAIPGHHFHIALQQELEGIPAFRRFGGATAYTEGWALYAESLGRALGVYTDPYSYFGYLQNELWRAIRLVVDTGLHSKGWTRKQTIDYMLTNSAISKTQAVAEAERYMAIPGQALAYKMGELKIKALRARAEAALGADFDIKAFHREILSDGALPLDVLDAKIDRWIAAQR